MNMETLVCQSRPEEHAQVPVSVGTYSQLHEKWEETQVLRCRDCEGKRIPKEKLDE